MAYYGDSTVFITGLSKPSADDAISSVYRTFSLCLIVDVNTDRIVDACCTVAMEETEEFVRSLLVGTNLVTESNLVIERIKKRFMAMVQKTLIVAYKDAHNRYLLAFPEKRHILAKD